MSLSTAFRLDFSQQTFNLSHLRQSLTDFETRSWFLHFIRWSLFVFTCIFVFITQWFQRPFIPVPLNFPIHEFLIFFIITQGFCFFFFKNFFRNSLLSFLLFVIDALLITNLLYFVSENLSLLTFLYFVNLIFCGFCHQRRGGVLFALLVSFLFSFVVSIDTYLTAPTVYGVVAINNLAFFSVAYLSGFLSEQLDVVGVELTLKSHRLKTLKNLNQSILSNMSSGLMTTDSQGVVVQHNPAACRILGLSSKELEQGQLKEIWPHWSFEDFSGGSLDFPYHQGGHLRGDEILLRLHVSALRDEVSGGEGWVFIFQDETHVRQLENSLRQSEKMAAIGQLAAGLAHEIRNPLASISGSVELLQDGNSEIKSEENLRLMSIVKKEIDRLNLLISEFLDFASPVPSKVDIIDLGGLLGEIMDFAIMDPKHSQIEKFLKCPERVEIKGNRDKLRQAFVNIIINGCQSMEGKSRAVLRVEILHKKPEKKVLVSIKDQGLGIDPKVRERIFEPFLTTKQKGVGLGLAITHSILENHGARVWVDSEVGVGSEFHIEFQCLGEMGQTFLQKKV